MSRVTVKFVFRRRIEYHIANTFLQVLTKHYQNYKTQLSILLFYQALELTVFFTNSVFRP